MTLKCWNATPPRKVPAINTSTSVESLLAAAAGNQTSSHMGRGRSTPKSARCRSQSSNWDKDAVDNSGESEDDRFDVTAATIPAPSHQIHAMPALLNQRLRITSPDGPRFAGWVRGQAAEVQWEALDPSVQCVRIDVCNVAWDVPTTIAHRVANDGTFRWRRVYWGMPIAEGYYVNIYDVTEQEDPTDMLLLAQSERFAVIK
ncbi:hypothetical protein PC110_g1644 [Phytophthora cactorum]|uniref:Uncharacterized protein n=1 Tax=Phytophthora cactorum TaxID=29920 RepID=A0A329T2U0_9STRA|nr:hypothetical protein PC110_g1644 [Phytophthora cactorum]